MYVPRVLLMAMAFFSPFTLARQEHTSAVISPAITALGSQYLRVIERSVSFPVSDGREDFVLIGLSGGRSREWRVIVIAGSEKPQVVWDSSALQDPYLNVTGLSFVHAEAEGSKGYKVALRGCVSHQCADGRIGFAVYASQSRRAYSSHITTKEDGSYAVTYSPKSGMPEVYRNALDRLMCTDSGISRPATLPMKCNTQ